MQYCAVANINAKLFSKQFKNISKIELGGSMLQSSVYNIVTWYIFRGKEQESTTVAGK